MSLRTNHSAFHYVPASLYKSLDMLPMLQAVSAGLALLEPWISTNREYVQLSRRLLAKKTSSKPRGTFCSKFPAKIEPFVYKVRGQSGKYYEALTDSAQVAQIGFNWTLDMERYCTALKRESGDNELLSEYLKLMREGARSAQRQAEELSGKFLRVCAALRQVSRSSFK